jgi:hypothetical protein
MYLKCGGLNSEKFSGKGIDKEVWDNVFSYYFDIWAAQVFLETFIDIVKECTLTNFDEKAVCTALINCFDKEPVCDSSSLRGVLDCLQGIQKTIDLAVNNCVFKKNLNSLEILVSPGKLFFQFPKIIEASVDELQGTLFVYLIDELENLLEEQQVYIQTLVRDRVFPTSIKLGVRTYGVKTLKTRAAGEVNRKDAEFEYVRLDHTLRMDSSSYKNFAIDLCIKRLKESQLSLAHNNLTQEDFCNFFEIELSLDELSFSSGIEGKTMQKLIKQLNKNKNRLLISNLATEEDIMEIPKLLANSGFPVIERFAVYSLYKKWSSSSNLLVAAQDIKRQIDNYKNDRKSEPAFNELIGKFKLDLVAQLRKDNSKKQVYAGVETLVRLSKGFPRSLLTILKYIYSSSVFNGEKPFLDGVISIDSQVEGVKLSSMWYLEDSRIIGKDGQKLKVAIERIAELFRINRYSDKPSECSLRAFSVNLSNTSAETQRLITLASNWSLLLKDGSGRHDKNSARVDDKLILNPMLAPYWGLPVGIRGVIDLSPEALNSIFDYSSDLEFSKFKSDFETARNVPFKVTDYNENQLGLL